MSHTNNIQPPKWPLKILRVFIRKEYLEEIEGDMEELFQDNVECHSLKKARRIYSWEMIRLIRPGLMKKIIRLHLITPQPMLKNYYKTSIRSLMKNPLSSFINVFGLSVAIGICLVVYAFLSYDNNIDQFHKNKNEVYLATFFADRDGSMQQYGLTPRPLGEMLKEDFPYVEKICRIEDGNVVIKNGDNVFHERVRYVDPEFLEMFTFPLKWGSAKMLSDLNSIILSEDMSVKYFGDDNPVGRDILVVFGEGNSKLFKVAGVTEPFPKARAIDFNFLLNFKNIKIADPDYDVNDWGEFLQATLIQVSNPSDLENISRDMEKYKDLQHEAQHDRPITSFEFISLANLHKASGDIRSCISYDINKEGRIGMPIIAIFMLALACFNYINIAIVSAAKRLKEIAVRKVIGAHRLRVIIQFLTENIVVTFFALLIGVVLAAGIFLPWFVQFSGWDLELRFFDAKLWIFLIALMFFTGIVSGLYPAFYISKFETVRIFKGSMQFGKKNPLTKIFLGIQLVLACITITSAIVFIQNGSFQYTRSWGYEQKGSLYVGVHNQSAFEQVNAVITQHPDVLLTAGSKDHLGKSKSTVVVHLPPNLQYDVNEFSVEPGYFEAMGLKLAEGRVFNKRSEGDKQAIVVNELLVKNFNLAEPIGHTFEIDSIRYEVIGVLKDFHTDSFFSEVHPTIFRLADEQDFRYLTMRVRSGSEPETYEALQKQWAQLFPEIPFQGGYQEDVWSDFYTSVDRSQTFNAVLASIAVLLASLGLYGLVTLNVSGRVKEFSIRKTLGAGLKNIAAIIVNQYALLVLVAVAFGAPISYIFAKAYLNMLFAYPMPMGYSGIITSVIILLIVLLAVVSTQIRRVLKTNPIEGLKVE